jgi:hypothetical protein
VERRLTHIFVLVVALLVFLGIVIAIVARIRRLQALGARARFIGQYSFPAELSNKLQGESGFSLEQSGQVLEALKQYFLAWLLAQRSGIGKALGMPSKAVDDAWREFTLMAREYEKFCLGAFGEHLPRTPIAADESDMPLANTLHQLKKRALLPAGWAMLGTMPLIFALDRELGVKDGHIYDDTAFQDLDRQRRFLARMASGGYSERRDSTGESGSL